MIDQIADTERELMIKTIDLFDQISNLIRSLDEVHYSKPLDLLSGSSIGQHIRHIVEFYQCLLQTESNGIISYDKRKRNPLFETNKEIVLEELKNIGSKIAKLNGDHDLELLTSVSEESIEDMVIKTSLSRELLYNLEHTIHHLAIIKVAVLHYFPSIKLNKHFGVAPSTIKFKYG